MPIQMLGALQRSELSARRFWGFFCLLRVGEIEHLRRNAASIILDEDGDTALI